MPVARARVSRTEKKVILPLLPLELWAPCKARWVWAGAVTFSSATCPLQLAKASAATLLRQEKNNSADLQRGRVNIAGFICAVVSQSSRRRPLDEFLSMAIDSLRAFQHWRIFDPLAPAAQNLGVGLRRPCRAGVWRHTWGNGAHCASTGRWRALLQHGPPCRTPRTHVLSVFFFFVFST
jgi:hypothetical protein